MDAKASGAASRSGDLLILRFTGMRRGSVASLRLRHVDPEWGLRAVRVKGGKTQDIPLPTLFAAVRDHHDGAVEPAASSWSRRVAKIGEVVVAETSCPSRLPEYVAHMDTAASM